MSQLVHRRSLLQGLSIAAAVTVARLFPKMGPIANAADSAQPAGLQYKIVNNTRGKFKDEECFWSLNDGKTWHSLAKEPTVACPTGNGRMYFYLGGRPKNFDDREAFWDFIEYAYADGTWHGNTTQVDAFCIPITIALGEQKVGLAESRRKLFEAFRKQAPAEFQACAKSDAWILSPCRAGFGKDGPHAAYFDKYIAQVWELYAKEQKTPSGKFTGKVEKGGLVFTPVAGGKPISCSERPSSQDAFLGTGVLASNPQFCAAINRHVLADPADWNDSSKFYQAEPCNWYSKFFHDHTVDHKAYGFCYDDVAEQAAFFSGKGETLVVTLGWE